MPDYLYSRQPAPNCPIGTFPYAVNEGETFYTIARRFNVSVEAILSANPGVNTDNLYGGKIICIPQNQPQGVFCPTANYYVIMEGDTLFLIAKSFNITISQLQNVNPGLNPLNLYGGTVICIPIAPSPVNIGINVRNKRLTLYKGGNVYRAYNIATGKPETPTPIGTFTIVNKAVNPGGSYGTRWMALSIPTYGIHGTNNPASIGKNASNGCIRMNNNDVNRLFNLVPVGTIVRIS